MRKRTPDTSRWWTGGVRSRDIGAGLRLVPYWERGEPASDRIPVIIDPGASFGGGEHPSTVMALELLEEAVVRSLRTTSEPSLTDVGTGTGVLAIAGKLLGAGLTAAFDNDPAAVVAAKRNCRLNGLAISGEAQSALIERPGNLYLFVGSTEALRGTFHIVAANLAAPLLLRIREVLTARCESYLVLSGIAEAMTDAVMGAYVSEGLRLLETRSESGWHAALLCREGPGGLDDSVGEKP